MSANTAKHSTAPADTGKSTVDAATGRELFLSFAKIGLFTFGGGYAMISLIENECVERKKWISHDEMMNITVIAESTPGPIAINCATYVGGKQAGLAGALIATLGMVLPSFIIIYLISTVFEGFLSIPLVAGAFMGIKAAVGLLIVNAAVSMLRKAPRKLFTYSVIVLSCGAMLLANALALRLSSVYIMLTAGVISLTLFLIKQKRGRRGNGLS